MTDWLWSGRSGFGSQWV